MREGAPACRSSGVRQCTSSRPRRGSFVIRRGSRLPHCPRLTQRARTVLRRVNDRDSAHARGVLHCVVHWSQALLMLRHSSECNQTIDGRRANLRLRMVSHQIRGIPIEFPQTVPNSVPETLNQRRSGHNKYICAHSVDFRTASLRLLEAVPDLRSSGSRQLDLRNGSQQRPDSRGDCHGKRAPESDAYSADRQGSAARARGQPAQESEEDQ